MRIETQPAARFTIAAGMKNGLILRGPPFMSASCSRSMVANPPMPLPMMTPTAARLGGSTVNAASFKARSEAAIANWMKRSTFLTSFFSIQWRGSKPFTSQANRVECWEASNSVMGPAPSDRRAEPCQVSSVPIPRGDTSPTPVTTTLRFEGHAGVGLRSARAYFLPECFSM